MSSDNAQSAVTYTSISSDLDGPSWGIPLMNADEFPKMDPYKEVSQQGQAHPLSPAYVPDLIELDEHVLVHVLEPEHPEYHAPSDDSIQVMDDDEDPEEDPNEEHKLEDDNEDPEEDPNEEHEPGDKDTREPFKYSEETEQFEEDETAVTPPPSRYRGARISVRTQTPMAASTQALIDAFVAGSSLFPLPATSPTYGQALLGHRTAMIHMRDGILEEDKPPWRRFRFTAPHLVLVMMPGLLLELLTEQRIIMHVTKQGTNDAMTPESIQAMIDWAIQRNSTHTQDNASQSLGGGLIRPVQPARVCSYIDFMKCQHLNFKGTEGVVGLS
nr:hypothetical protein [Tanacetum cinerariifolium]